MRRTHRLLHSTMPPAWVWPWIVSLDNVAYWSGFDRCIALDDGAELTLGAEWDCVLDVAGHRTAATLSVLDAQRLRLLSFRTEAPFITIVETFRFAPVGSGTFVHYDFAAVSSLPDPTLETWREQHTATVGVGLRRHLGASEDLSRVDASLVQCGCEADERLSGGR